MKRLFFYLAIICLMIISAFSSCSTPKDGCMYSKNYVGYGPGGYGSGVMKQK